MEDHAGSADRTLAEQQVDGLLQVWLSFLSFLMAGKGMFSWVSGLGLALKTRFETGCSETSGDALGATSMPLSERFCQGTLVL